MRWRWWRALVIGLTLASAGCNKEASTGALDQDLRDRTLAQLRGIGAAYRTLAARGQPPKNAEELRQQLAGDDALLKSPRDGHHYVVVWHVNLPALGASANATLLAWEKLADASGHRCILWASGETGYLASDEFQAAKKAKGK
jgi:hypothetical protein